MRKLLFRYPNVSYRQSEGEYRMVESIKNQIQKLFLSALIFHHERSVIHIVRRLAILSITKQFTEKIQEGKLKD